MFNKIKEALKPFLPAGHMAGRPPNPPPQAPPRPKSSAVIQPTKGPPPPRTEPDFPPVTLTYTGTEWQIKEEPVLELWIQSK